MDPKQFLLLPKFKVTWPQTHPVWGNEYQCACQICSAQLNLFQSYVDHAHVGGGLSSNGYEQSVHKFCSKDKKEDPKQKLG